MHGTPIAARWHDETSLRRLWPPETRCKPLARPRPIPMYPHYLMTSMRYTCRSRKKKESLSDTLRAVMKVSRGRHGGRARASVIIYGARKYFRFMVCSMVAFRSPKGCQTTYHSKNSMTYTLASTYKKWLLSVTWRRSGVRIPQRAPSLLVILHKQVLVKTLSVFGSLFLMQR